MTTATPSREVLILVRDKRDNGTWMNCDRPSLEKFWNDIQPDLLKKLFGDLPVKPKPKTRTMNTKKVTSHIAAALAAVLTFAGCASAPAEPLPNGTPTTALWLPVDGAASYRAYYLSNNAPDRPLFLNSQSWTRIVPDTTNSFTSLAGVPAYSTITVCTFDTNGNVLPDWMTKAAFATNAPMTSANVGVASTIRLTGGGH